MKTWLVWTCIVVGAVAFVAFDVWLIKMLAGGGDSKPSAPEEKPITIDLEELNLSDTLPPDVKAADVPVVRPKWLQLPPMKLVKLTNGVLTASVTRPDDPGTYKDSRFDWSGMVARVDYNGHWFFNGPNAKLDNKTNYPVFGTAEEFGAEGALGFGDARPGEMFVKIGVGELIRPAKPPWYWWGIPYDVAKPGTWSVTEGESWIQYEQSLKGPRGIGYHYVKRIALEADKPVMRISRTLTNTGLRPINTTHYAHNFVSIDGIQTLGPPWRVEFAFPVVPYPNPRYWRTRGIVAPEGQSLVFTKPLDNALFVLISTEPREASDHRFRIANPEAGAAVTIQGDRPLSKIAFYASNPTICPEPFINIKLEPDQKMSWETLYTFEADPTIKPTSQPTGESWREKLLKGKKQPKE
jgi:hypothetical protein